MYADTSLLYHTQSTDRRPLSQLLKNINQKKFMTMYTVKDAEAGYTKKIYGHTPIPTFTEIDTSDSR